ncbi:MAG: peroxide stress protein YaaA [Microbacteriaceae bacterium]|nr:peroxide stress protein YaaA [Microbacteriaceae bacterium]
MLIILPPSETKRDGGAGTLSLAGLSSPALAPVRSAVTAALSVLSLDRSAAMLALKLGATQAIEIDRNRALFTAPVLPALERYTGVLYDALDVATLAPDARSLAARSVLIHSALFGLLRADDAIPAYRLSHNSRLPGLALGPLWRGAISEELDARLGLLLDLRSASYVALGPIAASPERFVLRVMAVDGSGRRLSLTHFNKKGKGELVREILASGIEHESVDSLLLWAASVGIALERGAAGVLELTVSNLPGAPALRGI